MNTILYKHIKRLGSTMVEYLPHLCGVAGVNPGKVEKILPG